MCILRIRVKGLGFRAFRVRVYLRGRGFHHSPGVVTCKPVANTAFTNLVGVPETVMARGEANGKRNGWCTGNEGM